MAVKRSMKKAKPAPITRSIKRAPAEAVTIMDEADLASIVNAIDAEADFMEAPLTPEQQAEKDALEGSNAAAVASNAVIPERKSIENTMKSFRSSNAFKELMALPLEERRKLIEEDQALQKTKAPKK